MQNRFYELREKHPVFTYDKYELLDHEDRLSITYFFSMGDYVTFTPKWEFVKKHTDFNYEQEEIVHKLAFQLGLVELISYWKCACSPLVQIKAGFLDEEQIAWWKSQYYLGLGEFFYTNRIQSSIEEFMKIEILAQPQTNNYIKFEAEKTGSLIPVGGGKDSVVTMELLRKQRENNLCYMINEKGASRQCAQIAGFLEQEIIVVNRSLDANLLRLNKVGYLNGHTPFSAIVAFSSVLTAYLQDKQYVVLSNEASANESTVEGTDVNHQYSKSYRFELDFINYEKKYVDSGVHYFSLLRPFSEFQIAKFFAKQKPYYKIFRSCNVGSKEDRWCGNCPKCLFVGLILSPFIPVEQLTEIFGTDMFHKESLLPIFRQLIGVEPEKPFECVGTCDEINTAICITINQLEAEGKQLPELFEYYKTTDLYTSYNSRPVNPYLKYYNDENSVPEEFVEQIKNLMLGE